jgi:hypothetical protein
LYLSARPCFVKISRFLSGVENGNRAYTEFARCQPGNARIKSLYITPPLATSKEDSAALKLIQKSARKLLYHNSSLPKVRKIRGAVVNRVETVSPHQSDGVGEDGGSNCEPRAQAGPRQERLLCLFGLETRIQFDIIGSFIQ